MRFNEQFLAVNHTTVNSSSSWVLQSTMVMQHLGRGINKINYSEKSESGGETNLKKSPVQTDATLLANNSQHCWMLHVASVFTPCCMLLRVVAQSLKPVKLFSQQLPTFLLFRDRRSVAQHCWIRLHSSSNIVQATQTHYAA